MADGAQHCGLGPFRVMPETVLAKVQMDSVRAARSRAIAELHAVTLAEDFEWGVCVSMP